MYYPYFPPYPLSKKKKTPLGITEDPIRKQMPASDFAKAVTVMPDSTSYFQHMGTYLDGLTADERSEQFGTTPKSMIPAVELIDYKLRNRQPFTPPGTKLGFDMARSKAALSAPGASTTPDATTQVAGAMQKPPASMLTPAATPTQTAPAAQTAQPPTSGAPRFPQPGDPIPGWVHQLGEDVVNDFQDFVQYIKTASPQEQQEIALEFGIVAASFLPGAGDAIGVGADLAGLRHEENRNAAYLGLTLLGALPFVPPFNRIRKIKRLIREGARKWRQRRGMRRANQNPPANVPANQFDDVASARNADLDPDLLVVQATELGKDAAHGVANGMSRAIHSVRNAIAAEISDITSNPMRLIDILSEAIANFGVEVVARIMLNVENDARSMVTDFSEGAVSGLIGSREAGKYNEFAHEVMNVVVFDLIRNIGQVLGQDFWRTLNSSQILAFETALSEIVQGGVRTAFDQIDRSDKHPIVRALIAGLKHSAAAGANVGAITGLRLIIGRNDPNSDLHAGSTSSAFVQTARDIYSGGRK